MRMKCTRTRYTVAVSLFACRHDLVSLRRSRSSRTSSKMTFHGRGDEDCVPNLAFNRFTSTFPYGSYDGEVVFIEPMATKGSKETSPVR
jgi:hypothetical protein